MSKNLVQLAASASSSEVTYRVRRRNGKYFVYRGHKVILATSDKKDVEFFLEAIAKKGFSSFLTTGIIGMLLVLGLSVFALYAMVSTIIR
jgi:hypothetical protein